MRGTTCCRSAGGPPLSPLTHTFLPAAPSSPFALMIGVTISVVLLAVAQSASAATGQDPCNEAVCASVVSKCQLLERCSCDRSNTSCTMDCFKCLDYLYMECCSCVSICPKANTTESLLATQSHAEDLSEPLPSLFSTLTEEEDQLLRWTTFSFPVQVSFVTTAGTDPKENTFSSGTKVTMKGDGVDEEEDVQVSFHCLRYAQFNTDMMIVFF